MFLYIDVSNDFRGGVFMFERNTKIVLITAVVCLILISATMPSIFGKRIINNVNQDDPFLLSSGNDEEYYAVIAACSEYENPKNNIPKVLPPISEKKLSAFYNSLLESENWKEENIILLLNEDATKQKIIDALQEMAVTVDENDIFLFSWQGHGSEVPDDNGDEIDGTDEIICPHDIDSNTYITDDELDFYFSDFHILSMQQLLRNILHRFLMIIKKDHLG